MPSSIDIDHHASRGFLIVGKSDLLRLAISCAVATILSAMPSASLAEGFPGKGDPYQYSEALPHYNLGNRYLAKQWYEKAIEKYLDAINIYPYDADVYINLAVAYRKLGNLEGAEDACRKAVALNENDWASWSNLGNLLMLQDKYPESYKCFCRAMKCKIPAGEKSHIESSIDGMKKIMNSRALTIEGKSLESPAADKPAPAAKKAAAKVAGTSSKPPAAGHSAQSTPANEAGLDAKAYDQWLGGK